MLGLLQRVKLNLRRAKHGYPAHFQSLRGKIGKKRLANDRILTKTGAAYRNQTKTRPTMRFLALCETA
jgi:hypothetical protein